MPSSLKEFIKKQLKENVPLSEIKRDLQEKGYGIEIINKAVREAITGINKKISTTTIIQLSVLVVGVAIAIGIAVYLTGSNKVSQNEITFAECSKFPKIANEVSCEDAVKIALKNYLGVFRSIQKLDGYNTKDGPKNIWLVGINLNTMAVGGTDLPFNVIDVAIDRGNQSILFFKEGAS